MDQVFLLGPTGIDSHGGFTLSSNVSFLAQVNRSFDRAAVISGHDPRLLAQIRECNSVYRLTFPVKRR